MDFPSNVSIWKYTLPFTVPITTYYLVINKKTFVSCDKNIYKFFIYNIRERYSISLMNYCNEFLLQKISWNQASKCLLSYFERC